MRNGAQWIVLEDEPAMLVIADVGPHLLHPTVTNDVEYVCERLRDAGRLPPGRRLFYYDSEMELAEIVLDGAGGFVAFRRLECAF